jgi:hypothetical protein
MEATSFPKTLGCLNITMLQPISLYSSTHANFRLV